MDEHIVSSKAQLVAAIKAAAQPTYEKAKANPLGIICGSARYTFKEGIHESRARRIIASINRLSPVAFNVKETLWTT